VGVDPKNSRGWDVGRHPLYTGGGVCALPRDFLEFSSKKMQGFMHFYCEKLLVSRKRERGRLNRPTCRQKI